MYPCIAMGKMWEYLRKCMHVKVSLWAFDYMSAYYCSCEYANVCAYVHFFCEHVSVCLKVGMCDCAYTHILSMCVHAYVCMNRDKCRGVSLGVHIYMYCA